MSADQEKPGDERRPGRRAARARMDQHRHWADLRVEEAMRRGEFDDLPGAGKPLAGIDRPHDPDWWVKRMLAREQVRMAPPAIALRLEDAELDAHLDRETSAEAVRRTVAGFNARIIEARRQLQGGPPVVTRTRDEEVEVARWRERLAARRAEAARRAAEARAAQTPAPRRGRAGRRRDRLRARRRDEDGLARTPVLAVVVVAALAVALGVGLSLDRDSTRPSQRPTPTDTPAPRAGAAGPEPSATSAAPDPCAGTDRAFVPTSVSVPGVVRRADVVTPPRDAAGVPGTPPLTSEGKAQFAFDRASGIRPGSERGNALLNAHTWPDGSALGNRLLRGLDVGDRLVVHGRGQRTLCYRLTDRVEVDASASGTRYYSTDGPARIAIVVCSGRRLGPGQWEKRTLFYAAPQV